MYIALIGLNIILIVWIIREKIIQKKFNEDLKYIEEKISQIVNEQTTERVNIITSDKQMKSLLNSINEVLDYNHRNFIKYNQSKNSTKKMLSNVSHDLKTPLTVVLGYLEILSLKYEDEPSLKSAYARTQEVIELINKFFDLAKLESGDKEIPLQKVDIGEVCRLALLDMYNTLEELAFQVEIDIPEKPLYALANETAVKRVLNNLLSNAVKYGSLGRYLGLKLLDEGDSICVQVIDHGKGIERQHREEIFERMYTLEDSRSKLYQGSGLGLTISKELVEKMGGEIHLDSKPNVETIFSFSLPAINF